MALQWLAGGQVDSQWSQFMRGGHTSPATSTPPLLPSLPLLIIKELFPPLFRAFSSIMIQQREKVGVTSISCKNVQVCVWPSLSNFVQAWPIFTKFCQVLPRLSRFWLFATLLYLLLPIVKVCPSENKLNWMLSKVYEPTLSGSWNNYHQSSIAVQIWQSSIGSLVNSIIWACFFCIPCYDYWAVVRGGRTLQ